MKIFILIFSIFLISCGGDNEKNTNKNTIQLGKEVFIKNCQVCHGKEAVGLADDWRKPLSDGSYPPPPLNGTAHTWHHSPEVLMRTINEGGVKFGGKMPGFKNVLKDNEKQAVLDYLYSLWPDDIKTRYDNRFKK